MGYRVRDGVIVDEMGLSWTRYSLVVLFGYATLTESRGKTVIKGGKPCVLLGKKIKKSSGVEVSGINSWVDPDNLENVKSI